MRNRLGHFGVVLIIGLFFGLSFSSAAFSSEPGQKRYPGLAKQLDLSKDQARQLKEARQNFHTQNAAEISRIKQQQEALEALRKTPDSKEQRVALRTDLQSSRQALHQQREAYRQTILTPEQQAKLSSLRQQYREQHKKPASTSAAE
jgi:Spy/CpxP family protein refolding chaperone